jgi:hypothetical protein
MLLQKAAGLQYYGLTFHTMSLTIIRNSQSLLCSKFVRDRIIYVNF